MERIMRNLVLLVLGFLIVSAPVMAAVEVGQALPTDLALVDKNGELQNFDRVKGEKGAVLVFVRSADWCPFCQKQLIALREYGTQITGLGYNIVSVSYDLPDALKVFAAKRRIPYTMLSDKGSETIKAFGILNEDFAPDHFAYGVPHPTVYVVGADGVVQAVLAEEGYKDRPQIEAIVEAINGLEK